MKRLLTLAIVLLFMGAAAGRVLVWEFEMSGDHEYRVRYFARTGSVDLFGNAAMQNSIGTFIGFAGPNIYGTGNLAAVAGDSANSINPAFISANSSPPVPVSVANSYRITRGGFSRWGSDRRVQ